MDERNVIYRMRFQGYSDAEIARCLGCHRATIGRECKRNASVEGRYDPANAQTLANSRRRAHLRQPKTGHRRLMAYVEDRLRHDWSPEQIAGRLEAQTPAGLEGHGISHTTIYRWIWGDPQRAQQLRLFLRIARKPRRKPYGKPSRRGQIAGKRSIDERPKEANERQRLGDWEGDTVVGKGRRGYLLTCVDRASRYLSPLQRSTSPQQACQPGTDGPKNDTRWSRDRRDRRVVCKCQATNEKCTGVIPCLRPILHFEFERVYPNDETICDVESFESVEESIVIAGKYAVEPYLASVVCGPKPAEGSRRTYITIGECEFKCVDILAGRV